MAERRVMQAMASFQVSMPSGPYTVRAGEMYWSDDPLVMQHGSMFEAPTVLSSDSARPQPRGFGPGVVGAVETATAAPGSVRTPVTPVPLRRGPKGGTATAPRPDGEV